MEVSLTQNFAVTKSAGKSTFFGGAPTMRLYPTVCFLAPPGGRVVRFPGEPAAFGPSTRFLEPSNFLAINLRCQAEIISGRTIWATSAGAFGPQALADLGPGRAPRIAEAQPSFDFSGSGFQWRGIHFAGGGLSKISSWTTLARQILRSENRPNSR